MFAKAVGLLGQFLGLPTPTSGGDKGSLKERSVTDLNSRLEAIEKDPLFQAPCNLKITAPHYAQQITCGQKTAAIMITALVVSLIFIGIVALVLASCNHLLTFPQDFLNLFHNINYIHLGIGVGIPFILITGAGIVIHRARTKKEQLLASRELEVSLVEGGREKVITVKGRANIPKETNILKVLKFERAKKNAGGEPESLETAELNVTIIEGGTVKTQNFKGIAEIPQDKLGLRVINVKYTDTIIQEAPKRGAIWNMEKHLGTVLIKCDGVWKPTESADGYIDYSTLDEDGSGKAYIYGIKDCGNHYTVSTIVPFLATPFYFIGTMVYNLIRAVIVPFYVLVQYLREAITGKTLYPGERPFELLDIPKEFVKSIWRIVKAPFYALAFFFAGVYSISNPMGGRKLAGAIERDWNEGVSLAEGYWSVQGEQKLWRFEGGGGPLGLGRNGFYLAGCWQPMGVVEFFDGKIMTAYWLPKAIDPHKGVPYQIYTRLGLETTIKENQQAVNALVKEHDEIVIELNSRKK